VWITIVPCGVPAPAPLAALDHIQYGYNPNWNCPLTPFENQLKVPIRAGEKVFHEDEDE
jgi:hypothetical protein